MIKNNIKKNKLVTVATVIFMTVSAAFMGLTVLLSGNLLDSIDNLMSEAKTCDFLQMHSGELDMEELEAFADSRDDVEDMLVADFLNIENSSITLNGISLSDSTQDNGLCVQNESFDHLLGTDNEILHPSEGTVYVPVCYKSEYDLSEGQIMQIGNVTLTIEGFLRDSQMNSMMASSKRFLVSPEDYEKLENIGSQEYLIEFLIKDGCDINGFATAYADAGLPCNGPTITAPLIRTMNALSDGMMILIIFSQGGDQFQLIHRKRHLIQRKLVHGRHSIIVFKCGTVQKNGFGLHFFQFLFQLVIGDDQRGLLIGQVISGIPCFIPDDRRIHAVEHVARSGNDVIHLTSDLFRIGFESGVRHQYFIEDGQQHCKDQTKQHCLSQFFHLKSLVDKTTCVQISIESKQYNGKYKRQQNDPSENDIHLRKADPDILFLMQGSDYDPQNNG